MGCEGSLGGGTDDISTGDGTGGKGTGGKGTCQEDTGGGKGGSTCVLM